MDRRQQLRFPICELALLTVSPNDSVEITTVTENISTTGVLLRSTSSLAEGSRVQVRIPMPSGAAELKGSGSVVRTSPSVRGGYFLIAVACDQPFDLSSRPS
jgi:PilZ domain